MTNVTADPAGRPRVEGQPKSLVAVASPLAMVGLFLVSVRARFSQDNAEGLPWYWDPDLAGKLRNNIEIPDDPSSQRPLLIETAYNEDTNIKNYRPAVFIDKGETVLDKLILDNKAGVHLPSQTEGSWTMASIPIEIECLAEKRFESAHIAEIIQYFIWGSRKSLRQTFGLHELTPPLLSRTSPRSSDTDIWTTSVAFTAQVDFRTISRPLDQVILKGLDTKITSVAEEGAERFFQSQVVEP